MASSPQALITPNATPPQAAISTNLQNVNPTSFLSPALGSAHGQDDVRVVPFKITGGGPAPDGLPLVPGLSVSHSATGHATHLGNYTGSGTFTLGSPNIDPTTGAVSGTFQGSFVFVAADGSQLAFNYGVGNTGTFTGQLNPDGTVTNVTFDAVFTVDPALCAGRFADVVGGSFEMVAHADSSSLLPNSPYTAPFNYTWSGQGSLVFSDGQ